MVARFSDASSSSWKLAFAFSMSMGLTGELLGPTRPESALKLRRGVSSTCWSCRSAASTKESMKLGARVELARDRVLNASGKASMMDVDLPSLLFFHLRESDGKRVPKREVMPSSTDSSARRRLDEWMESKSVSPDGDSTQS